MRIDRDGGGWLATQGIWYGLGKTRVGAMLDCLWACADALLYGLTHPWGGRWSELRRWMYEVFAVGDR